MTPTSRTDPVLIPLPRRATTEERFESRPRRRGEVSEARRLEEGFRLMNGADYADDRD